MCTWIEILFEYDHFKTLQNVVYVKYKDLIWNFFYVTDSEIKFFY